MRWTTENDLVVRTFGGGPDVVWIHGLGEWSVSFDPVARHPQLAGFQHVLVDLPGYGRAPWRVLPEPDRDSLDLLADRIASWLGPRDPAVLIGHSMGGVLATMVAERTGVLGVINVEGNLTRGDCTFSAEAAAYTLDDFCAHGFAAMRARIYERGLKEPAMRGYHAALTAADPATFHRNATDLVALSSTETMVKRLASLTAPTLFIAGVPGGICERSRALLDQHHIPWVGIEPTGHWPFVDRPDDFVAEVAGFLRPA